MLQKRAVLEYNCSKRFAKLAAPCRSERASTAPFGVDPVFTRSKDLFNLDVADNIGEFYNTSEIKGGKIPKGFKQRPEDEKSGREHFSVFFDIVSRQSQAYRMLGYLIQGNFIDTATTSIEVFVVSYNPNLSRFISTKIIFEHTKGGKIETSTNQHVLNLGLYDGDMGIILFIIEILTIVWILYQAYFEAKEFIDMARSEDFAVMKSLQSYITVDSANMFEATSIFLQISAFSIWWFYQFQYALKYTPLKRYEVGSTGYFHFS